MALPPPLLTRTAVCIAGTCVHEHISPLLGEHLIVNICLGPVTVHYREVSLYTVHCKYFVPFNIIIIKVRLTLFVDSSDTRHFIFFSDSMTRVVYLCAIFK